MKIISLYHNFIFSILTKIYNLWIMPIPKAECFYPHWLQIRVLHFTQKH